MNIAQWLSQIESFHPEEIELGLDRIAQVARELACLDFDCPVVSVAGTNGKGSTVKALSEIAQVKGLQVGVYTSPHLVRFNERISVNGFLASDADIVAAFEMVESTRRKLGSIALSFFEFTTLAALLIFKQSKLDLVVLEVGLGGRLDAVNIVDADISIITNIGIDHEAWLGNSRELIAVEKAGVARAGRYCLVGDSSPPESLLETLESLGAQSLFVNRDFIYCEREGNLELTSLATNSEQVASISVEKVKIAKESLVLAIMVFHLLGKPVSSKLLESILPRINLPGRFQVIQTDGSGLIVLDLCHNPHGAHFLSQQLKQLLSDNKVNKVSAIFGAMADKDIRGIVEVLIEDVDEWLICELDTPRAARMLELEQSILKVDEEANISAIKGVESALKSYLDLANDDHCLLVLGSFFSVGPVLDYLEQAAYIDSIY